MKFTKTCGICKKAFTIDTDKPMIDNEMAFGYRDANGRTLGYTRTYTICPACLNAINKTMNFLEIGEFVEGKDGNLV